MSRAISKQHTELATADGLPQTIGRGSGMTIREMGRAIRDYMVRKQMPSRQWRTKAQVDAARAEATKNEQRSHRRAMCAARADVWAQL